MIVFELNDDNTLIQPATMQVALQDVDGDETGRVQSGDMERDRIVGGADAKRKVSYTWSGIPMAEMSRLLQAMKDSEFYLTYPDPYTGAFRTAKVYVGDRTAPMFRNSPDTVGDIVWESLSANFIEY